MILYFIGFLFFFLIGGCIRYFLKNKKKNYIEIWKKKNYRAFYSFPEYVYENEIPIPLKVVEKANSLEFNFFWNSFFITLALLGLAWLFNMSVMTNGTILLIFVIPFSLFVLNVFIPEEVTPLSFCGFNSKTKVNITENLNNDRENNEILTLYRHFWRAQIGINNKIDNNEQMNEIDNDLNIILNNSKDSLLLKRTNSTLVNWFDKIA